MGAAVSVVLLMVLLMVVVQGAQVGRELLVLLLLLGLVKLRRLAEIQVRRQAAATAGRGTIKMKKRLLQEFQSLDQ